MKLHRQTDHVHTNGLGSGRMHVAIFESDLHADRCKNVACQALIKIGVYECSLWLTSVGSGCNMRHHTWRYLERRVGAVPAKVSNVQLIERVMRHLLALLQDNYSRIE